MKRQDPKIPSEPVLPTPQRYNSGSFLDQNTHAVIRERGNLHRLYTNNWRKTETKQEYIYLIRWFVGQYRWVFLRVVPYFDEPVGRV